MSDTDDPTKKYPPPEDYLTRNNLEEMLTAVVRNVITQDVLPRLDRIEHQLDHLESETGEIKQRLDQVEKGQKDLIRSFRHYKAETEGRLVEMEDRLETLESPKS